MFWLFNKLKKKLSDWDERNYTKKEWDNNEIYLDWWHWGGRVVVSTDRKRLYWSDVGDLEGTKTWESHRIYEYILSWNAVFVKLIQYSIEYCNHYEPYEKQFIIKNWEVIVDWIYKMYNDPGNLHKETSLEKEIERYKNQCLLNRLYNMKLTMFILSKSLSIDALKKVAHERVKLMNKWEENYKCLLSNFWIHYPGYMEETTEIRNQIEKKWKEKEYNEGIDNIAKACECTYSELFLNFDETMEIIKSYLK